MIVQPNRANGQKQSLVIEVEPGDEVIIRVKERPNVIRIKTPQEPPLGDSVPPVPRDTLRHD